MNKMNVFSYTRSAELPNSTVHIYIFWKARPEWVDVSKRKSGNINNSNNEFIS